MNAPDDIEQVRGFNRLVTRQVGVLSDRYLGRLPLGESRVLFEIAVAGSATPRDVRARLGLDSGYLARMIRPLKRAGFVEEAPAPADRRTKRLRLTRAGRAEMRALDRLADGFAASTLEPLTDEKRERLLQAEADVRRLLAISMIAIEPVDPSSADARWCLSHYYAEIDERFEEGFEPGPPLPAEELTPPAGAFLLARFNGQPAGCGVLKTIGPGVGEFKRMCTVRPNGGLDLGGRVLEAHEQQPAALGHTIVRLDTNRALPEAQKMYRSHGYTDIERYNDDNPYADFWFEKRPKAGPPGRTKSR